MRPCRGLFGGTGTVCGLGSGWEARGEAGRI
jgi:hypothetical protein